MTTFTVFSLSKCWDIIHINYIDCITIVWCKQVDHSARDDDTKDIDHCVCKKHRWMSGAKSCECNDAHELLCSE